MYNLEDVVVYKKVGLCKIIKISEMNSMDYYTLETLEKDMTVMCPISKEDLLIRKVVTLQEISQIKSNLEIADIVFINNIKERKDYYEELLKSAEPKNLAILIKTLIIQNEHYKKLTGTENEYLEKAEKLFYPEICYVLEKAMEEVKNFFFEGE